PKRTDRGLAVRHRAPILSYSPRQAAVVARSRDDRGSSSSCGLRRGVSGNLQARLQRSPRGRQPEVYPKIQLLSRRLRGGLSITSSGEVAVTLRRVLPEDLYELRWAADPRVSPDGLTVAFVARGIDREANEYRGSIWLVSADGSSPSRQLTAGARQDV